MKKFPAAFSMTRKNQLTFCWDLLLLCFRRLCDRSSSLLSFSWKENSKFIFRFSSIVKCNFCLTLFLFQLIVRHFWTTKCDLSGKRYKGRTHTRQTLKLKRTRKLRTKFIMQLMNKLTFGEQVVLDWNCNFDKKSNHRCSFGKIFDKHHGICVPEAQL